MNGTNAYDDLQRNLHKWSLKEDQQVYSLRVIRKEQVRACLKQCMQSDLNFPLCEIMDKQKVGTFDAINLIRLKVIATKVRVKKLNSLVDELNALIENISQTKFLQQNVGDDKRQEVVPSVKEAGSRESETLAAIRTAIEHGINEVAIAGKEINAISALPDLISGSLTSESKILRETTPIQDDLWEESLESQSSRTQPVETKASPKVIPPVRREVENHAVENRRSSEEGVKERQELPVGQYAHRIDSMKRPSEHKQEYKNNLLWESDSDEPLREKKDQESIVRVESTSTVPEKRVRAVAAADEGSSSVVKKPQIDRSSIHRDMQRDLEEIFQRRSKAKPESSGEHGDSSAILSSSDHLRPTTVRASISPPDTVHEESESLHTSSKYSWGEKDETHSTPTEDKLERFMSGDVPVPRSKEPLKPSKEPVSSKAVIERKQTVESVIEKKPAPVSSKASREISRTFPSERILGARVAEKYKSIFDDEDDDDDLFDIKPKKEHVKVAAEPPKKAQSKLEWEPPRKAKTSLPESEPLKKAESTVPDSGPLREAQSSLSDSESPKKAEPSVPDSEPLKKTQSGLPESESPRNLQSPKSELPKKAPSRLPESQFAKLLGEKLARGPVQPSDIKPAPVTSTETLLTIDSSIQDVSEGSAATSARPFTPLASVTKNRTRGPNRRPPTNRMAATATTTAHGTDDVLEKTAEQNSEALSDNADNTHALVTERETAPSVAAKEEAPLGPLGGTEQASASTLSTAAGTPLDISNGGKDKASVSENVITRPPMWLDESSEETPIVSKVISNSKTIVHITSKMTEKRQQESANTKEAPRIAQDIGRTSRSSQSHIDTKQHNPVKSFFDADSDDDNEDYPPVTKRQDESSRSTELPKTTKPPDVKAASSLNKSVKPIIITAQSLFDDDDDSDLSIFQIPMRMPSKLADSQFSKLLGEKLARGPAQPHEGRSTASPTNASSRPSEVRTVSESNRKHREHATSSDFKPLETVTKGRTRGPNRKPRSSRRGVVTISSEGRVQVSEEKESKENVPVPTQAANNEAKTTSDLSSSDSLTKKSDLKSKIDKKTSALPSSKEDANKIETPSMKSDRKTTLRIKKVAVLEGKSDIDKTGVELVQRISQNETRVESAGWKSKRRDIWQGLIATGLTLGRVRTRTKKYGLVEHSVPNHPNLLYSASEVFLQTAKLLNAEHVHIYSLDEEEPDAECWDEEEPDAECWLGASVTVCYMPWMTHYEGKFHDCFFFHKEGGGCTRNEVMRTRTKKCESVQESKSYSELVYPDSVYTASTKVFLRIAEHLNAEHVHICLALVEGIESALKNLPPKLMITCSVLNVEACRFSFLKLLFPFVKCGCGLRIHALITVDDAEEAIVISGEAEAIDSAIFDFELVKTAPFLEIFAVCGISDGQLSYLKACWIYIDSAPQISEEGLIRMIMQWVDNKRRINSIYLGSMLAVSKDMIYKVRGCKLIAESELTKTPFLKNFMEKHFKSGCCVGIRNKAGNLILVNVSKDSCEIADPYSEYDPPFSRCSLIDPFDDDD